MKDKGIRLMQASMILYLIWLLLPAVQTTGRAASGCACVALFALGVTLDWAYLKQNWLRIGLRALCMAALPVLMRLFLGRGGNAPMGFYVQNAMFFFPLAYAGHARERGDRRLWQGLRPLLLVVGTITLLTTTGWLIEGILREGDKVYAYSRSLGYAGEGREAYLKELMLRNIGGYDFVYAMVAALPLAFIGVQTHTGAKRAAFIALAILQTVMIVLSQYTYAMLYAAAIWVVEAIALLIRRRWKVSMGKSLLLGAAPLLLGAALMLPLAQLAVQVCTSLGFGGLARSFELLLDAFQGGELAADSRLGYYLTAVRGFLQSPLIGDLAGGEARLSYHSDVLDLLSGMGVLGAAAVLGMIHLTGRGLLRGVRHSPHRAQLCMMAAAVLCTALLGTVVYSRDLSAVCAIGTLLVLEGEPITQQSAKGTNEHV